MKKEETLADLKDIDWGMMMDVQMEMKSDLNLGVKMDKCSEAQRANQKEEQWG